MHQPKIPGNPDRGEDIETTVGFLMNDWAEILEGLQKTNTPDDRVNYADPGLLGSLVASTVNMYNAELIADELAKLRKEIKNSNMSKTEGKPGQP